MHTASWLVENPRAFEWVSTSIVAVTGLISAGVAGFFGRILSDTKRMSRHESLWELVGMLVRRWTGRDGSHLGSERNRS
jgi:hypothetical protein